MTPRILFVSNGVGEDLIASRIIASLPVGEIAITAYPLAGLGAYPAAIPLLDPRRELPSGGFSLRTGLRGLGADLASGMIRLWFAQRRTLKAQRGRVDLAVAVGDVYCLRMARLAAPRAALVATADSARIRPYGRLERRVLRRHARRIFVRDPETAGALAAAGLPATSAGNVMMDLMECTGETFGLPADAPVVTLLPGSRRDAPENAALLAQAACAIAKEVPGVRFLLTVAPTVSGAPMRARLGALDEAVIASDEDVRIGGAHLRLTASFADAAARAQVIIGMAGTANEQAAGLGKPVIAFPGPGPQFGPEFLAAQHRLLGDAVVPVRDWRDAAGAVVRLLHDPAEGERRGAIGRERMGPPGGAHRIAQALLEMIQNA